MANFADLTYRRRWQALGDSFFSPVAPTALPDPYCVSFNPDAAALLDLAPVADAETVAILAGNRLPPAAQPTAALYSGHQFGVYVPQLGDGRAILLAEVENARGDYWELQLKGAGLTPYSRMGDGRAVLRSCIREYLCSEAMHGLGIPTTRALAIMGSAAPVYRESVESAAVLTRLAPSHIRFGNFEVFFYRQQYAALRQLADFVIAHFYPQCLQSAQPYQALLEAVIERTARLMAAWQAVGFCHGVMNSDNMSILGLTLDYGPFGFLDGYDPGHICNHSDEQGRYAYDQQPDIGLWNLYCLAQAMIPLLDKAQAEAALLRYPKQYKQYLAEQFRAKLGLLEWQDGDWALLQPLLELLAQGRSDWTRFWRALSEFRRDGAGCAARDEVLDREGFDAWLQAYAARLELNGEDDGARRQRMLRANPNYVLRNHLAEVAIRLARDHGDFSEIERLRQLLATPFDEQPGMESYAALPPDWAGHLSVSCSS